jgi:leucyl aminopeptidase (aminopeptidase T)
MTTETGSAAAVDPSRLEKGIETAIDRCLGLRPEETVVVVGDPWAHELCDAFWRACRARGSDAVLITIGERFDGEPPPPAVAALLAADIFFCPTRDSLSHTAAVKAAIERGARGATLPGITADIFARLMAIDFDELHARSHAVAQLLEEADKAHLTCRRGTNLVFDLTGRRALVDVADLTEPYAFGNLPAGEGAIAPANGNGTMACGAVHPAGMLPEPLMVTVEDGQLVDAEGPFSAELLDMFRRHGRRGTNLAELGVGTNPAARVSGLVQEDEKIIGSCHVAFGASTSIGGTVYAPIHRDLMVYDATLTVGETQVLEGGQWVLDFSSEMAGR